MLLEIWSECQTLGAEGNLPGCVPIISHTCSVGHKSGDRGSHGRSVMLFSLISSILRLTVWGRTKYLVGKVPPPKYGSATGFSMLST